MSSPCVAYTAKRKLKIIEYANANGNRAAGRFFNVNESNIRTWKARHSKLLKMGKTQCAQRGKKAYFPKLEEELVTWVKERRQQGFRVLSTEMRSKALSIHKGTGVEGVFKASTSWCYKFIRRHNLSNHRCSSEVKTYHQCLICNEMFEEYSELEIHNKTHIKIEQTDDVIHNKTDDVPQHDQQEMQYTNCVKKEKTGDVPHHGPQEIHNKNRIKMEQTDDVLQQDICNSSMVDKKLDKNIDALTFNGWRLKFVDKSNRVTEKTLPTILSSLLHECRVCEEKFEQYNELEKHCQMHTSSTTLSSNNAVPNIKSGDNQLISLNTYSFKTDLDNNLKATLRPQNHGTSCSKTFAQSRVSVNTRTSYECDVCLKSFSLSNDLSKHMQIHTAEKAYKCDVCLKAFTQRGNLSTHMRIHTGEKPYKCDVCLKAFRLNGNLSTHRRIHTGEKPYKCDVCLKVFYCNGHLSRHMKIHTEEKPHNCDVSHEAFVYRCDLSKHMRNHTGE